MILLPSLTDTECADYTLGDPADGVYTNSNASCSFGGRFNFLKSGESDCLINGGLFSNPAFFIYKSRLPPVIGRIFYVW